LALMIAIFRKPQKIHGVAVPRRSFTIWAAVYFGAFVCVPIMVIAFGLDALLFALVDKPFGTCLSVLCWAG